MKQTKGYTMNKRYNLTLSKEQLRHIKDAMDLYIDSDMPLLETDEGYATADKLHDRLFLSPAFIIYADK
tara:strand:- start:238 stop:444 length:207 start_codon:yes stop_codon:yes gene_type:complete